MSSSAKKDKRKGILGTILFHGLLLVAFLFMGLTYQIPPPPEEGISINFGFSDEGLGKIEPESTEETTEIVEEEVIEQQIESTEEIVTQSETETPAVEKKEEKEKVVKKEDPKEEVIEEEKPEVNKKALYPGKKKNENQSEGEKGGEGNQGVVGGDPNSEVYEGGGIGEDGTIYLEGREVRFEAIPVYGLQIEGKVVVNITVDRLGDVIIAIVGKGTTTLNKQLLQRAKTAAMKTKFDPKPYADVQQGKIIYHFRLN